MAFSPSAVMGEALGRISSGPGKIIGMATLLSMRMPSLTVSSGPVRNDEGGGSACVCQARR